MALAGAYVTELCGTERRKAKKATTATANGRKQPQQQARQQARQDKREAPPEPQAAPAPLSAPPEVVSKQQTPSLQEQVALLQELCSGGGDEQEGASTEVLEYVLTVRCCGDMERASHWALTHLTCGGGGSAGESVSDVVRAANAWQAEHARRKAAAGAAKMSEKDARKALVSRYEMTAAEHASARKPVVAWDDKKKGPKTEIRYRDGVAVKVRKGEKYSVVDSGKPEWDGGSRGKVITKGKRGKGFV